MAERSPQPRSFAEVDFPLASVSRHSVHEKPRVRSHPKSLHLWWARRPLAACRAMLLGLLVPDPCDRRCSESFKEAARRVLQGFYRVAEGDTGLRTALKRFIGDIADYDVAGRDQFLIAARDLVKANHGTGPPLVADTFAGGGSIPLEALRLGADAYAGDLNPVSVLINKVLLETLPGLSLSLRDSVLALGERVERALTSSLAALYPALRQDATPIAYIWARTIRCEASGCGLEVPLVPTWWLANTPRRKVALAFEVGHDQGEPALQLRLLSAAASTEMPPGTIRRGSVLCPRCTRVTPVSRVRAQLGEQRGGGNVIFDDTGARIGGAVLLAVVESTAGVSGRTYRLASSVDYSAVYRADRQLAESLTSQNELSLYVPDEPLPPRGTLGFRIQAYGMSYWRDLFSSRQLLALATTARAIHDLARSESAEVTEVLALTADRLCDFNSTLSRWAPNRETSAATFGRHALPMLWSFCETSPISGSIGSWGSALDMTGSVLETNTWLRGSKGTAVLADAASTPLPDQSASVWFIDPPYYDAIPYADLADFFLVWLRRMLPESQVFLQMSGSVIDPKDDEIVQDGSKCVRGLPKDRHFFETRMAEAFAEGRRIMTPGGVGCVVFAHKTTEGWEALLGGMIKGGFVITASWPIATERPARLRSLASAALATSVHLVCRPRLTNEIGDWGGVLAELPERVGDWMERLQSEGVRGADLVFACIGPALEIYSRYSKVVDAEDREIPLGGDPENTEPYKRGYLAYVWEVVGRAALAQILGTSEARARNGATGAVEEDARLTALFLWTLQSTNGREAREETVDDDVAEDADDREAATPAKRLGGPSLIYDVVRRFAQPLGIHLPDWERRIIETSKGVVRLLPVAERAKQLFGDDGADAMADHLESNPTATPQLALFPDADSAGPRVRGRGRRKAVPGAPDAAFDTRREATTLDRVHAAMLLQRAGRANALRALLSAEQDRGPDFLRLANALSALYPKESEEKRLLDAMLLAVPR